MTAYLAWRMALLIGLQWSATLPAGTDIAHAPEPLQFVYVHYLHSRMNGALVPTDAGRAQEYLRDICRENEAHWAFSEYADVMSQRNVHVIFAVPASQADSIERHLYDRVAKGASKRFVFSIKLIDRIQVRLRLGSRESITTTMPVAALFDVDRTLPSIWSSADDSGVLLRLAKVTADQPKTKSDLEQWIRSNARLTRVAILLPTGPSPGELRLGPRPSSKRLDGAPFVEMSLPGNRENYECNGLR